MPAHEAGVPVSFAVRGELVPGLGVKQVLMSSVVGGATPASATHLESWKNTAHCTQQHVQHVHGLTCLSTEACP